MTKEKELIVQEIGELMNGDDGDLLEMALKMMTMEQLRALKVAIEEKSP